MSQYWKVDETMRIGQSYISIPSENGLEYKENQKIQIFVDPSTKYMDGKESYLDFNFKIDLPAGSPVPTRLQLDEMGGNSLIKNIRIYDGSRGNLLESLDSYSTLCAVRYDYDADDNMRNYRALREGSANWTPANRGTMGTSRTGMANTLSNPYFKKTSGNQNGSSFASSDFLTAKICIPLNTGIFAQNDHIFPIMMTNGLYIELDTAPASEVLKQLDSVVRTRRTPLNPFFHSLNGSIDAPNAWPNNASTFDTFYVSSKNNLSGSDAVSKFPFVVGETLNFANYELAGAKTKLSAEATISEINLSSNGLIEVKLVSAVSNDGSGAVPVTSEAFVLFSTAVESSSSYDATYTISNVNLVVSQVHLDPNYEKGMIQKVKEGKAIEIDIMTATNYKSSILASDRQTSIQIFSNNAMAKSLLVVPQDSTVYSAKEEISAVGTYAILPDGDDDDTSLNSNRSAYTGICDELQEIQYQIDGQGLVPSRPINVAKIASQNSIDNFHLYELEKCLDNAGIVPRSFKAFRSNFVFGRGFAVNNGAVNLAGKNLAIILKYTGSQAPTKAKLFNSFIFHVRRLMIRENGISVVF